MAKRKQFVRTNEADKRALALHAALSEIEKMPLIGVYVSDGPKPITLYNNDNPKQEFWSVSIDFVLSLDIEKARQAGGTYSQLMNSRKAPRPRPPQAEVSRAVESFLTGEEEETPPE
jgi:hypothetical protein